MGANLVDNELSVAGTIDIDPKQFVKDFRTLPRKQKKERLKAAKQIWKSYEHGSKTSGEGEIVFLAILAVLLPPLAVLLKENKLTKRFWICLLLSLFFLLPGIVYALLIVFGVI